ncbi:DNA-binding domain-containing protein [Spirochaeta cellobiosiphila]|uniref:DNA-binding domain-containing protein n=1 Tax=Spirochaeta cellobiosiphila TaxID=504483 RepID=UPI000420BD40|nr:DNA-binding domain-containing protein [Spirochaeta cellobiosiphila]
MNEQIIYYETQKNHVNEEAGYHGKIQYIDHLDPNDIIDSMVAKNTTITRQDALAVISLYEEVIIEHLQKGYSLATGLFQARLFMKGRFQKEGDLFDKDKHTTHVVFRPAIGLNDKISSHISFHKRQEGITKQYLKGIHDFASDSNIPNEEGYYKITRGNAFALTGSNLKIYHYEGRYKLNLKDSSGKIYDLKPANITPSKLTSSLARDLPEGLYTLSYQVEYGQIIRDYGNLKVQIGD